MPKKPFVNENENFFRSSVVEVEQKELFFLRSRVFLFEVCNNDSYVVRDVPWA